MEHPESEAKIFRLPYAYYNRLMPGVVGGFCIGIYLLIGITERMALMPLLAISGILALMWGGAVLYSRWMFANNYLAISQHGIVYRAPGIYVDARWSDLDYIGQYHLKAYKPRFNRTLTVIYLKEHTPFSVAAMRFFSLAKDPIIPLIPVGDFGPREQWRKNEIGRLLRQYAPHLKV